MQRDLMVMVDDNVETEPTHFEQVTGFVNARQHDDTMVDTGGAQTLAVGDRGDTEGIGTG